MILFDFGSFCVAVYTPLQSPASEGCESSDVLFAFLFFAVICIFSDCWAVL